MWEPGSSVAVIHKTTSQFRMILQFSISIMGSLLAGLARGRMGGQLKQRRKYILWSSHHLITCVWCPDERTYGLLGREGQTDRKRERPRLTCRLNGSVKLCFGFSWFVFSMLLVGYRLERGGPQTVVVGVYPIRRAKLIVVVVVVQRFSGRLFRSVEHNMLMWQKRKWWTRTVIGILWKFLSMRWWTWAQGLRNFVRR